MMKVILREKIERLGNPGDIVAVSDGYARNYLLPRKKALPATKANIKNIEEYRKTLMRKQETGKAAAEEIARQIEASDCIIEKKTGKNEKLFGAVTTQDIYGALLKKGFNIDKRRIELEAPIKTLGNFQATIHLHPEVKARLNISVKAAS